MLCDNTEEPSCNEPLYNHRPSVNRTIFFTPVIVKLMETTLVIVNICHSLGLRYNNLRVKLQIYV